jgi:hypothetical protein
MGSIFLSITTNLLQFASCLRKLSKIFYREVSLCRNLTRAEIQPSRPINREGDGGKEKRNRSQEQRPGVARHFWPQGAQPKGVVPSNPPRPHRRPGRNTAAGRVPVSATTPARPPSPSVHTSSPPSSLYFSLPRRRYKYLLPPPPSLPSPTPSTY